MLFLQRYVHVVLDAVLGSYVKDIDPEALKISVWNGKIEVDVVELQPDAFPLPPEFRIVKGTLHQVRIDLPWANLASQPIRVDVQDVNLLLEVCDRRPETSAAANAAAEAKKNDPKRRSETLKRKRATLDAIEKATQFNKPVASEKPTRWTQTLLFKLLVKVLDNVQLNVQHIHLRMEDHVSSPDKPFAVGVTLASMVIKSADAGWNYTTIVRGAATPRAGGADDSVVASFLRKKVDINKFGLYWSLPLSPVPVSALEDSFEFMKLMQMNFWSGDLATRTENARLFQPKDYIIEPLTLSLKLTVNDGRAKLPITHEVLCTRVMARLGTPWMVQTITAIGDDAWRDFVNRMPKLTGDRIYTLSFVFSQAWAVAREHNDEEDVVPSVKQFKDALSSCLQWSLAEVDRLEGSIAKYRDAVIHVLEEKSTYIDASASVDHINVVIQRQQYLSALNLVSFLAVKRQQARYAHLRPMGVRVREDPRRWWGYAISAVLIDVRERLARVNVEEIREAKAKRSRYKALYIALAPRPKKAAGITSLVGLVPDDVLQLPKEDARKELDDLEVQLDIKELFQLRNTARQSLIDHTARPTPPVAPTDKQPSHDSASAETAAPMSSKLWAYTSWLYSGSSSGGEAKTAAPAEEEIQWSDQDTKTLFEAIDFDPDEDAEDDGDGLAMVKRSGKQGQHIWYRCQFLLAKTSLRLVGDEGVDDLGSPLLAAVALRNVDFKVLVRPKSIEVGIQLGDASVIGLAGSSSSNNPRLVVQRMNVDEIISHHPKSVSDNMSSVRLRHCERVLPLIDIGIELMNSKRKTSLGVEETTGDGVAVVQGIAVSVVAQAIKCDFDVGALLRVSSFFARPSHVDLTGLRERAWRQAQSLQRYSAAQVHAALARRSNVELLVDIISPLITIRQSPASLGETSRNRAQLLVFLGHLRASSRRGGDAKQDSIEEVSLLTGSKPENHLYDEIEVGVTAIEVLLSDDSDDGVSTVSTQLLEKTSVHIGVFVSIAPNDPTIPLVKVVGGVESVRVNLDADTFGLLLRLLRSIGEDFSQSRVAQSGLEQDEREEESTDDIGAYHDVGSRSVDASASHDSDAFFSGFETETRFFSQPSQRSVGRSSSILASSPAGSALYGAFARMRDAERDGRAQKEIDDKDLLKLWQRILFMIHFQVREVAVSLKLASSGSKQSNVVRVVIANIETELDMRTYDKKLRFMLGSFSVEEQRKGLGDRFLIASGDLINCSHKEEGGSVPQRLIRLAISSVDLEAPKPKDVSLWSQICGSSDLDGQASDQNATVWQDQLLTWLSVDARLQTLVLNLHQDAFADLFVFFFGGSSQADEGDVIATQSTQGKGVSAGSVGKPPVVRKVAKSPSVTERRSRSAQPTTRKAVSRPGLTSKIGTWVASSLAERMSVRRLRREPSVVTPDVSTSDSGVATSPASIQLRLQVAGLSVVLHNQQQEAPNGHADDSVFIRLVANDFGVCVHRFPEYLGVYAHLMSMRVTDETVPDTSLQEILGSETQEGKVESTLTTAATLPGHIPTVEDVLQVVNKVPAIFSCAAQLYGADNIQEAWHPGYASRFTVRLNSPRIRLLYRFLDDLRSYFVDGVLLQTVMRTLFPHQVQVAWDEDFLVSSFSSSQHPTGYGASPRPPPVNTATAEVVSTFPLIDIRLVDAKLRIPVHRTSTEALVVRFDTFRLSNEYLRDMFRGMNNPVMAKVLLNSSLSQLKMDLDALRVVSVILVDSSYDAQPAPFENLSAQPAYLRPELLRQSLLGSTSMTLSADFSSGNATTLGIEFSPLRLVCNREQYAFLLRLPIQNFGEARLRPSGTTRNDAKASPQTAPSSSVADVSSVHDLSVEELEDEDEEEERELVVTVKVPHFALEILHGQDGYQPSTSGDMSMAEAEKRAPGSICSVDVSEFNASVHYGMKTRSVRASSELLSMRIRDTRHDSVISSSYRDVVVFEPPNIAGVPTPSISIRVLHGRLDASLQQEKALECSFASPHHQKPQSAPSSEESEQQPRRLRKLSSSFFGSDTMIGLHPVPRRASSMSSGRSYPFSKSVESEAGSEGSIGSQGSRRERRSAADARSHSVRTDVIVDVEGFRVIPSNIHYDVLRFLESPGRAAWSSAESSQESEEGVEECESSDVAENEESTSPPEATAPSTQTLPTPQHYIVLALTLGTSAVLLVEDPSKALSRAVMFSWEASVTVEFLRRPTPALTAAEVTPPNHRLQVRVELSNVQATSRLSQNNLWTRGNEATSPNAEQSSDISGDFLKPCGLECRLDVDFATGFVRLKASFDRVLDLRFGYLDVCSLRGALEEIVSFSTPPSEDAPNSSSAHGTLGDRRLSVGSSVTSSSSALNPELDRFTLPSTRGPLSEDGDVRLSSHRRKPRDRSIEASLCYGTTMVYLVSATFRGPLNVRPAIGLYSSPWRKRYLVLPYTAQDRQSVQPTMFRIIPATGSRRNTGDPVRFGDRIALQAIQPVEKPAVDDDVDSEDESVSEPKEGTTGTTICKYDQLGASGYLGPDGSAGVFETRIWKYGTSAFNSDRSIIRHKDAIVMEELTIYRAFSKQGKTFYGGSRLVSAQFDMMENGDNARASGEGGGYLMFNGVGDAPIPFVVSVNTEATKDKTSTPRSATKKASTPKPPVRPQSATTSTGAAMWNKLKVFQFHLPGVNATVVNDFHNMLLPLLHLRVVQLTLDLRGSFDSRLTAMAGLQVGIQSYNSQLAVWEPLVEDFDVHIAVHLKGGAICDYCMSDRQQISLAGTKLHCEGIPTCLFGATKTVVFAPAAARASETKHFIYQELLHHQAAQVSAPAHSGTHEDDAKLVTTCLLVIKKAITVNVSRNGVNVLLQFVDLISRAGTNAEQDAAWRSRLGAFVYVDNQSGIPFLVAGHSGAAPPPTSFDSFSRTNQLLPQSSSFVDESGDETVKLPTLSVGSEEGLLNFAAASASGGPPRSSINDASWINNEQLTAVMKDMMSKSTRWLSVADGERVATDIVAHEAPAGSVTSPLRRLMWMRPKSSSSSSKPIPVPIGYSNRSYLHLESRSGFKDTWHGESIICETVAEQGTLVMRLRGKVQLLNHLAFPVEVSYNDQRQEVLAANGRAPHFVPIQFLDGGDMTLCPLLEDGRLQRSTHISIASLLRAPVVTTKATGAAGLPGALEVRKVLTFYWDVHPDEESGEADGSFGVSRPPFQVILTASRKSEKSEALITISPPIRLENLVPFALSFRTVCTKSERDLAWVHENAASFSGTHGTVASGQAAQICELEIFHNRANVAQIDGGLVPSAVALSVAIPDVGYRTYSTWSEASFIYGSNKLCSRIELIKTPDEADDGGDVTDLCPLHLRVEIVSTERLGATALNQLAPAICRIYAEYWLIDRTCLAIVMRTPDGRRVMPWSNASDRHAPVALFSGLKRSSQATPKIKIGVHTSEHDLSAEVESKAFDIGTVGLRGQITLRAGDRNVKQSAMSMLPSLRLSELTSVPISHKQYDIGVMIEQGPSIFSRTTVVTFVPRYYFINTSDRFQLLIKQERDEDANAITLRPRQGCFFHWNDDRLRNRVQLRFVCLRRQCTDTDFGEYYDEDEGKEETCSTPHGVSEWSLPFEVTSVGNFVIRLHRALAKASSFFSESCFLSEDAHAASLANADSLGDEAPCEALSGMSLHVGVELHDPAFVVRFQEGRTYEASTEEETHGLESGGVEPSQVKDFVSFKLKNECTAFELFVWQKIPANDTSGAESGDGNATAFTFEGFDRVFPFQTIDFVPFSASVAPVLHVQIQSVFQSSTTTSVDTGDDGDSDEHSGVNATSSSGVAPPRVVGSFEVALDKLHRLPVIEIQSEGKSPKRLWVEVALEDATKTLRVTDVLPGASSEHKRRRRTALLRSWKRYNASVLWYSRVLFESHRHKTITATAVAENRGEHDDATKQRKQVRFANDVKESSDGADMEEETKEVEEESLSTSQSGPALVVAMRVVDAVHLEDLYPPETNAAGVAPFVRARIKGKQDQEIAARTLRTQSTRAIFPRWVPAKIKKSKGSEILFQRFSLEEEAEREQSEDKIESDDPLCVELEVREGNKLLIFGSSLLGSATISLRELVEAARGQGGGPQHQPLQVQELLVPLVSSSSKSVGVRSMVRIQFVVGSTLEDPTLSTTALEDAIRNYSVEAQLDRLVRCKSQLKVLLERESVDLALGDGTSAPTANGSPPAALAQPTTVARASESSSLTAERLQARQDSSRTASTAPSVTTDDSGSDLTNDSSYDERVLSVVVMGVSNLQLTPVLEHVDEATGSSAEAIGADADRKVYCTVSYKESTRAATSSVAKKSVGNAEPALPPQPSQGRGQRPSQTRFVRTHKFRRGEKLGLDLIYHNGRVVVQGVTYNGPCGKLVQDGEVCIGDTIVAVNDKSIVNLHRDSSFRAIANACGPTGATPNVQDPGSFLLSFLRQPPSSFGHVAHAQDRTNQPVDRYEAEWNRRVEFVETPQSVAESGGESDANKRNKVLVRVYKRNELSDHGLTAAQESSVVPFLYFFGDEDTMDHLDHSKEDTRFDSLIGEAWVSVPTPPSPSKVETLSDLEEVEPSIVSECLCALYAPTSTSSASFSSTARPMVGQVRLALKWEHRNSYAQLKKQQQLRAYVQLEVHGLFISIVDDGNGGGGVGTPRRMPREVMSISLSARHADTGIQVSYGLVTDGRHVVNTRIGHLQVDNQLLDTNYPVMVFPIRLDDTVQQDQSATTAASVTGSPTVGAGISGRTRSNGMMPDVTKQPGSEGAASTRSDRILLPTFQLMGVFSKRRTLVQFEYIFAQLQELDVKLEDAVLVATAQAMSGINWSLLGYGGSSASEKQEQAAAIGDAALNLVDARWPFPNTPEFPLTMLHVEHRGGNTKVLLRWLLFCPIKMNVTFTSTTDRANLLSLVSPEMSSVLRTLISAAAALVSNLDNAAIKVPEFYLENVLETTHTLGFYTMQHYVHHGLRSWYRIVGSVDFLGNPIGLVSALGTGVKDFFYTPAQMLLEDENGLRIENLRTGMTKGSKSLLRNTAVGIFHTTGKITETLGKGIALLAMDDEYNVERQRQTTRQKKKINDLGDAIAEGGKGLVGGVWDGVKGVITAPVRGAERDGAGGFVVGIGQGFAGLFVKPAAGFLDMLTSLSRGAKSSAEAIDGGYDHGGLTVTRARLPRRICADGVLVSFSEREARGCAILALTSLDLTDDYVYHLDYGVDAASRGMLLLTDKRVLCLNARSGQKLWELALDSSLQVETNGTPLLTIAQSKTSHRVYKIECDDETAASNFKLAVSSARVELAATRYLLLNLEKKQDEAQQHALLGNAPGMHGYDDDGRVDLSLLMGNLQDTLVTGLTETDLRTQPLRSVQVELCHLENKDAAASVPSRAVDKVLSFSVFQILVYGGPYQWTVYRRFSEFRDLYATLQKTGHSVDALPPLPGRTFLPSTRNAVATQRQEALSLLLQASIMHSSISGSHALLEFLTRSAHEVRVSLPPLSPAAAKGSSTKAGGVGAGNVGAGSRSGILRSP